MVFDAWVGGVGPRERGSSGESVDLGPYRILSKLFQ